MTYSSKILEGKVVVVTGCNRGIGLAILQLFLEQGAIVYGVVRKEHSLDQFKDNRRCYPVYMDICDSQKIQSLFLQIQREQKRLDVLVNNAGIMEDALIGMISKEQIKQTYNINVFAVIEMIQYAVKFFRRQRSGVIINIASIMGVQGNPGQMLYSSAKGAVVALTKSAAKELAPWGIRVNAIAPGAIDTDMLNSSVKEDGLPKLLKNIYAGRVGTTNEVAETALFLASDMSKYVMGQIIGVDGAMIV